VKYAGVPGYRPLELDLYLPPAGDEPAPAVAFLHGGGWRLGSRESAGPMFRHENPLEQVAAAGIAVASVDYRLSAEAIWPAQLHDAKAAVRWLRSRADELHIDAGRIAAWGESAGGHLAALLGLTDDDPALEGEVGATGGSSRVEAVAAWYPPTDLTGFGNPEDANSREGLLLGAAPSSVPERAAEASPLTHVSPGAPPFLLLHGRADRFVPCQQSEHLATALQKAGREVTLKTFEGADHMWLGAPEAAKEALSETLSFLLQHLQVR
jgi:acetyl esterase/lipase